MAMDYGFGAHSKMECAGRNCRRCSMFEFMHQIHSFIWCVSFIFLCDLLCFLEFLRAPESKNGRNGFMWTNGMKNWFYMSRYGTAVFSCDFNEFSYSRMLSKISQPNQAIASSHLKEEKSAWETIKQLIFST